MSRPITDKWMSIAQRRKFAGAAWDQLPGMPDATTVERDARFGHVLVRVIQDGKMEVLQVRAA